MVAPVRVAGVWFPKSRFDHASHTTMAMRGLPQGRDSGMPAAILLLPDIASCRQCHGGEHASNLVPTTCINCHAFHDAAHPGR
jgi:hypothetical protein